ALADPFQSAPITVPAQKVAPRPRHVDPVPEPEPEPEPTIPQASVAPALDPDAAFWQAIAGSDKVADFEEYVRRYPSGRYVSVAQEKISALKRPRKRATFTGSPSQLTGGERVWTYEIQNTVPHDTEKRVAITWKVFRTGPYCKSLGLPNVTVQSLPHGGTARLGATQGMPTGCESAIEVMGIFYKPSPGFTGQDQLVYRRKGDYSSGGWDTLVTVKILVE